MIQFTRRHVCTNSDAYISSSLDIEVYPDPRWFALNPGAEDLNNRFLSLAIVGKETKKKMSKRNLDSLGKVKAWIVLSNVKESIKRLKSRLKIADTLGKASRMYQT